MLLYSTTSLLFTPCIIYIPYTLSFFVQYTCSHQREKKQKHLQKPPLPSPSLPRTLSTRWMSCMFLLPLGKINVRLLPGANTQANKCLFWRRKGESPMRRSWCTEHIPDDIKQEEPCELAFTWQLWVERKHRVEAKVSLQLLTSQYRTKINRWVDVESHLQLLPGRQNLTSEGNVQVFSSVFEKLFDHVDV